MKNTILNGDCRATLKTLPDDHVHCVITSPPYWNKRSYLPKDSPLASLEIGQEATPKIFIEKLVNEVFSEVWRVLRPEGTCWLNLGDGYAASGHGHGGGSVSEARQQQEACGGYKGRVPPPCWGLKRKDLMMLPHRLAMGLQEAGWWVRMDIVWHKLAPMVESVDDRPTLAHEYLFILTKSERCFYDAHAIKEPWAEYERKRRMRELAKDTEFFGQHDDPEIVIEGLRNKRSVWPLGPTCYTGDHHATFSPELVKPCILAGTSEKGCCAICGAPYQRIMEKAKGGTIGKSYHDHQCAMQDGKAFQEFARDAMRTYVPPKHKGWAPTCTRSAGIVPCRVLDPFGGSGTVAQVANEYGRDSIMCELNPEYHEQIERRSNQPGLPLSS